MATNNRLRNNCQVQIAHNDSNIDAPYKNLDPELKTFCCIPGIRNLKLNHN
jgi:hypothetical protein